MIREVILTTLSEEGEPHLAPMGVHVLPNGEYLVMPFRPSRTLDNLLATGCAVMNYCDDVRIFAGCLTGRREWPIVKADRIAGVRLASALAHSEITLDRFEDDPVRARFFCKSVHETAHAPFRGFNRAQAAVLEAAILVSRLGRLPPERIRSEWAYLQIAIDKTAGPQELEAWTWLMERVESVLGRPA